MEHPDLNFLIQREIQNDRIREARSERLMPKSIAIHPFRRIAGGFLITMGNKIAATQRPITSKPAIGGVALAGRNGR
jgi:hypothetical protein